MAHRTEPGPGGPPVDLDVRIPTPSPPPVDVDFGPPETVREQKLIPLGSDGELRWVHRYRLSVRVDEGLAELYDTEDRLVSTRQPVPDERALREWATAFVLADLARGRRRRTRGYDVVVRPSGATGQEAPRRQGTVRARDAAEALELAEWKWNLPGLTRVNEHRIALAATAHRDAADHSTREFHVADGRLPARAPDEPERTVGIER